MLNLYTSVVSKVTTQEKFTSGEKLSVAYHNLFDYALTFEDLIRWQIGEAIPKAEVGESIFQKNGYFFLEGKESLIYQRLLRKRISAKKIEIAKRASRVLSFIPSVKMVAVTGSLAMENSKEESDIDLLVVAKKGSLWTTRLLAYVVLKVADFKLRKPFDKNEKDKLCLNMWFDESDLTWKKRNLYTAHEIAQITPLLNRDNTYERFLLKNSWILKFWPNSVRVPKEPGVKRFSKNLLTQPIEKLAFSLQYFYMRRKITREIVTPTRALFHPLDWSKVVLDRLKTLLVE